MKPNRFSPSTPKPKQTPLPKGEPKDPILRRADSLPAHLPSNPLQRTEVKPKRKPISPPIPDTVPPKTFQNNGCLLEGSTRKIAALKRDKFGHYSQFQSLIENDKEYMDVLKSRHPNFEHYSMAEKDAAFPLLMNHPGFLAEYALIRNKMTSIPSGATSSRMMQPEEQKFLTNAFKRIREDLRKERSEFHMHGETILVGNKNGDVTRSEYSPAGEVEGKFLKGEKYNLHNHRPLGEPLSSSASKADHLAAAELYKEPGLRMQSYLTNGKDALHIRPDSTDLVKLIPDPKVEAELGKFPVAFEVPDPRQPPYPFSNHEAPAASGR